MGGLPLERRQRGPVDVRRVRGVGAQRAGRLYTIYARAFDNRGGSRASTAVSISGNAPPAVTLTGPASGTLVNLDAVVSFTASAGDADCDAVSVTYLANGAPFSPAVGPPFTFTAATALAGTFAITARATDARGGVTDSAPRSLVINAPPVVTSTSPAQGTVLAAGQPFTVAATASDPDDTVQRVEFSYNGGIPMGTPLYAPPYQLGAPSGVPAGTYTVTARAFDTRGLWTDSVPVTFTVTSGMEVRLGPAGEGETRPWLLHRRDGDPGGSGPSRDTAVALLAPVLGATSARTRRRRRRRVGDPGAGARFGRWLRHGLLSLVVLLGLTAPAKAQVTIEYYHLDPMGSVRMVTDASGDVTQRYDYQVFGEEPSAGGQPRKYAGKERDPETGYDYFGGRYYANRLGRFTTVDPAYRVEENLLDSQRWNRYTYVRNNPYKYTDPDGRILFDFQEFRANVSEALHFGQDGYGYLVPTVAAISAIGSLAGDAASILSSGATSVLSAAAKRAATGAAVSAVAQRTKRVEPASGATGPHTTWKTDSATGEITRHETWAPNSRNPRGWDSVQSTDVTGRPHTNSMTNQKVPTPHTQGSSVPGGVRPATSNEIPRKSTP